MWCRRARVLAQQDEGLLVGNALVRCECVTVEGDRVAWSAVTGVNAVDGSDRLETSDGEMTVEGKGVTPFPSAARRLAALAKSPPTPPMLPPVPSRRALGKGK